MINLLFLVILGGVVLALLFLFWRTSRQEKETPPVAQPAPPAEGSAPAPTPVALSQSAALVTVEPGKIITIVPLPKLSLVPTPPRPILVEKVKQKRPKSSQPRKTPSSPIRAVLAMLKKPSSLVSAFVLREILDKPMAVRRKPKGREG